MNYPNDFDIPAFSAGKTVALARSVSVWNSIVLFLVVVACGFLLLCLHLRTNFPFIISVDPITEDWSVVTYPGESKKIPQYRYIQEKLVNDFTRDWFTISGDSEINEDLWQECSVEECDSAIQFDSTNKLCALSCKSSSTVFQDFKNRVEEDYRARIKQKNEKWTISKNGLLIKPIVVSQNSSKWQVFATVNSSVNGQFTALIFVDIERNTQFYPATLGYYINNFNAYRYDVSYE